MIDPQIKTADQIRTATFDAATRASDGRIPVVISSDAIVPVFDGPEILLHTADAVDLTRAPIPIIVTHKSNQINVGNIEDITIGNGIARGMARFGSRDEAAQYGRDVVDGIIRSVSVGYRRVKGYMRNDGVLVTSRWMPTHVALVAEPADVNAGFYRTDDSAPSFDLEPLPPSPQSLTEVSQELTTSPHRAVVLPPTGAAGSTTPQGTTMSDIITDPAPVATPVATRSLEIAGDPLAAERERAREIRAIGRQFEMVELADRAIDSGMSLDAFRSQTMDRLKTNGTLRPAESPEIGLSKKEIESYSFCRALLAASDPLNASKLAPFETECSRAAQETREMTGHLAGREAAITIPLDVLARGMAMGDHMAGAVARQLIQRAMQRAGAGGLDVSHAYRDLVVGTPTAGGNLVATELLGSSFIDLLRNAMVLDQLGITWLRDLNGNLAIPSQTGGATGYWLAESGAPTESQQTIGQMALTPKTMGAYTDYSRRMLLQSSLDVEAFVRADLAALLGQTLQIAAINGSGVSNEPTGLLNISGIGSVAGGANGLAPTYANMVDLESAVANANADSGNLAFLTNTKVRGTLRKTQEFASTNGKPVWTSMAGQPGVGDVLGYTSRTTNAVPSNLTKGTSVSVASAILFGNWSELVVGMWGGLDIMLDPFTGATSGTRRVIALQDVDINVRRVASFAAMKDALTA